MVNGIGSASVKLPPAPDGATYVRVELACHSTRWCSTPGGKGEADQAMHLWQRDAIPLTDAFDPTNAQDLEPLDPTVGFAIHAPAKTQWRLYAT